VFRLPGATYDNLFPKVTRALRKGISNVVVGFLHQAQTWTRRGRCYLNPTSIDPNWGRHRNRMILPVSGIYLSDASVGASSTLRALLLY